MYYIMSNFKNLLSLFFQVFITAIATQKVKQYNAKSRRNIIFPFKSFHCLKCLLIPEKNRYLSAIVIDR